MFFDPLENQVIDYVGGQADLAAKKLRAIGNAHERFREDRLRMLRAIRLAARFSFVIDEATQDAVRQMSPQLGNGVSAERIAEELRKILTHPNRVGGMQLFVDLGLAAAVMPELMPMCGLPQGLPRADGPPLPPPGMPGAERLPNDLWEHTLSVLAHLPTEASFPLALAAVLHDVGKPRTVGRTPDRYTFHGHEHVGRRVAETISNRLKLSNQERERIEWLVEKHQILAESAKMRPAKLKPLLVHPGIAELFDLHEADALASGRGIEHVELAKQKRREWEQEGSLWPEPLITGENLMQEGLQPGPIFKTLLEEVRNAQLDGTIHTQSEAIQLVRERLKGA
jgi:poly(A) polymerase